MNAFPIPITALPSGGVCSSYSDERGMTMRQYYKAAALTGLIAAGPHDLKVSEVVRYAACSADIMIKEDEEYERNT